jgi:hypothetical protein
MQLPSNAAHNPAAVAAATNQPATGPSPIRQDEVKIKSEVGCVTRNQTAAIVRFELRPRPLMFILTAFDTAAARK